MYKQIAAYLEEQEERTQRIYEKPKEDLTLYTKEADVYLSLDLVPFVKAFELFLQKKKRMEEVQKRYSSIKQQQMTIESRIEQIKQLFRGRKRLKFRDLVNEDRTRQNVVLTFLSMLELIRQKAVKVNQNVNYGEITFTINEKDMVAEKGE